MNKGKVTVWLLGFLTLIICSYFYLKSNRYYVSVVEKGVSYKIDRWTGKTWLLLGDEQIEFTNEKNSSEKTQVTKTENKGEISVTDAIEKVKSHENLSGTVFISNESRIKNQIEDLKGEVVINGWKGEKINNQTFLVWYEIIQNGKKRTSGFEYNTKSNTIRRINSDDQVVRKKYSKFLN